MTTQATQTTLKRLTPSNSRALNDAHSLDATPIATSMTTPRDLSSDDCTHGLSDAAKRRLEVTEGMPLFLNDWVRAVFVHYEVEPAILQAQVPYELDLRGGKAYVSLVAFTMRRLRPCVGGRVAEWLSAPASNHGFLNVRTYVKHRDEPGIFFLTEWLPNPLSVFIGTRTFGLPYRYGHHFYRHNHERGELHGQVSAHRDGRNDQLIYNATVDPTAPFKPCAAGSRDEWLMERYTAFTERLGGQRMFRVWHEPWEQTPIDVTIDDTSLLETTGPWFNEAKLVGANYSPGTLDIWIGRPQCINGKFTSRAWDMNV